MSTSTKDTMRFKVGERVVRLVDVHNAASLLRHGTIIERYAKRDSGIWYPELYAVLWDDGTEQRAFLPHGLTAE